MVEIPPCFKECYMHWFHWRVLMSHGQNSGTWASVNCTGLVLVYFVHITNCISVLENANFLIIEHLFPIVLIGWIWQLSPDLLFVSLKLEFSSCISKVQVAWTWLCCHVLLFQEVVFLVGWAQPQRWQQREGVVFLRSCQQGGTAMLL